MSINLPREIILEILLKTDERTLRDLAEESDELRNNEYFWTERFKYMISGELPSRIIYSNYKKLVDENINSLQIRFFDNEHLENFLSLVDNVNIEDSVKELLWEGVFDAECFTILAEYDRDTVAEIMTDEFFDYKGKDFIIHLPADNPDEYLEFVFKYVLDRHLKDEYFFDTLIYSFSFAQNPDILYTIKWLIKNYEVEEQIINSINEAGKVYMIDIIFNSV